MSKRSRQVIDDHSDQIINPKKKQKIETQEFVCSLCEVRFNSPAQLDQHKKGKKHKRKELSGVQSTKRETSPLSDHEDYEEFRKNAPRPKKKNRVRERKSKEDKQPSKEPIIQKNTVSGNSESSNTVMRKRITLLSEYCLLQHSCNFQQRSLECSECHQDLRNCKLHVSISNSKIQFLSFDLKEKFNSHEEKIMIFLQSFILLLDTRATVSVFNSFKWTQSLFTAFKKHFNLLEEIKSRTHFHSIETSIIEKIIKEFDKIDDKLNSFVKILRTKGTSWNYEDRITLICSLDEIYYNLYYCWSTVIQGYKQSGNSSSILDPLLYFRRIEQLAEEIDKISSINRREQYLESIVGLKKQEIQKLNNELWKGDNELLQIYLLRYTETIRLFPTNEITIPISETKRKGQSREPPCSPIQQMWRDSCRDWLCHIYAYAVPNENVISLIKSLNTKIIEIGAGTGYWGSLFQQTDIPVYLYDSNPLSSNPQPEEGKGNKKSKSIQNEYHGKALAFASIRKGGITDLKILSQEENSSLLLCYPPPKSSMAFECLQNFTGKYIIYIGEWQGDTGTLEFEKSLLQSYSLIQSIGLPNWNNTCYLTSIWERKDENIQSKLSNSHEIISILNHGSIPLQCTQCKKTNCFLKRCEYCAQVSYCSQDCSDNHSNIHKELHRFYHMHHIGMPNWNNHYKKLKKY